MKNHFKKFKAFTLVELLIVIVIIGILMSALLPRLQGAQDIARDTARGVSISQLQTAIMSYRSLKGKWPSNVSTGTSHLSGLLDAGILTDFPTDPISMEATVKVNKVKKDSTIATVKNGSGDEFKEFFYIVVEKNGGASGGIILATRMETDTHANYVSQKENELTLSGEYTQIYPCKSVSIDTSKTESTMIRPTTAGQDCTAPNPSYLRYITKL